MLNTISRAALVGALLAAAPAAVFAQTTKAAETASAAPTNDLEGVVVSASPSGAAIATNLLGSSISLVAPQDVEARQVRIVSDLLRDIPGVAVSRTGTIGGLTQVRIRGAEGNHTVVLVDGIYAADPAQGEFDFASLYADEGARLEVLRGQQPIYGSNAIAGVIHYITATGKDAPGLSARVEGGSFNTGQGSVHYGVVQGPFDFSASAGYYTTDGTANSRFGIRELDAKNTSVSGKLIVTPSEMFRLIAVGRYSETLADTNPSDFSSTAKPSYGLPIDGTNFYRNFQRMGLLRAEVDLLDGHWKQGLAIQGNETRRRSFNDIAKPSSFSNGGRTRYDYDSTLKFDQGDFHHTLTGKVDLDHTVYRNVPLTATVTPSNTIRHINNLGLTAQYDLDWKGKAGLSAAVRHDKNTRFLDATTYRVSGSYLFDMGTRLRAAAGSGITNPTFNELYGFNPLTFIGNPNLKPERSHGWEVGADQTFLDNQVKLSATYFDSRLKDEIFTAFTPTFVSSPNNRATDSTQRGIELSALARIGKQWRVDGAYTYLHARENGVKEIRRPDNTASLNVSWRSLNDKFGSTVTVRYNGKMTDSYFGATTQTKIMPAFTLVNLNADFKINSHLQVYGRVEDLFNTKYEEVYGYVAPARAAYVGIRAAL